MPAVQLLPTAISELLVQVTITGQLTLADRYGLLAAVLDDSLSEEDRRAVNRILHALRKGRVQVVDELSTLG